MPNLNKKNKVTDIEPPIASNLLGRDILGINAHIPAVSKTSIDLQDEAFSLEHISKIK